MILEILGMIALVVGFNYSLKFIKRNDDVQNSNEFHLIRRIQHLGSGLVIIIIAILVSDTLALYGSFFGFLYFLCVHVLRKKNERFNQMYLNTFKFLLRPHEIEGLPGAFFFLLGVFLSLAIFDKPIAMIGILFLSFGDPFASLCGIYFKTLQFMEGKSISGTLGCGVICTICGIIFRLIYLDQLHYERLDKTSYLHYSIACFLISILAEIGPNSRKYYFDDNLTIPIYTCILFELFFRVTQS
ncbi:hypothetical protein ABPG74_009453 [Tetrahymena malaccensis]